MTFGKLVRRELEKREMSVRDFQKWLHKEKVKGSAYSSVWSFLKHDKKPPLEFVRAAAEVLEVPERWLETGEGPRTERKAKISEAVDPEADKFGRAWRALGKTEGRLPFRPATMDTLEREAWRDLAIRLLDAGPERQFEDYDEEGMVEALEPLAWLLWFPIMALRPGAPPTDREHYFLAMYQALSLAMPEAGEGNKDISMRVLRDIKEAAKQRSQHSGFVARGPDRRAAESDKGGDDDG